MKTSSVHSSGIYGAMNAAMIAVPLLALSMPTARSMASRRMAASTGSMHPKLSVNADHATVRRANRPLAPL